MAKFKLKWKETTIQYWETTVEANTAEEVEQLYYDGNHITGDEEMVDEDFLDSEFDEVEEIKE